MVKIQSKICQKLVDRGLEKIWHSIHFTELELP